jgi:deazaflavin-dependent oxidoreductase (nitroreductase family)
VWRRILLLFLGLVALYFFAPRSWFYQQRRPTLLGRWVNRSWVAVTSAGLFPERWPGEPHAGTTTLETTGRRSGKTRANVVTWVEHDGERYLVSMLGERVDWVRNARAANGGAAIRRRGRRAVRLEEVPVEQRAPILRDYLKRTAMATKMHLGVAPDAPMEEFQRIATDHPVFRIADAEREQSELIAQARA